MIKDKDNIHSYWPMEGSEPRESQTEVLDWIASLPPHIKYILCEVPVGGGKSPLALNLSAWIARSLGNAYILTPQKVLQKQYEDSFDENQLHSLYGKANYRCESKQCSCELGSAIKPRCETCPHAEAFQRVMYSPNVVLNYTLGLLLFKYVTDDKVIKHRNLIVFDEAHTLENHLTEFNAVNISEFRCKQIGSIPFKQFTNIKNALEWLKESYMPALVARIGKLHPVVQDILESCAEEARGPSGAETEMVSLLTELTNHKDMIMEQLLVPSYATIVADYVLVNEGKTLFKFKELYGKRNFRQFVEPMADKFLFMSSTILDKDAFCSDLGLNPEEAAFISLDSEFEVENRPIYYMPTAKMSFGWDKPERATETKKILDRVIQICNSAHSSDSGIIHTGSFQIAAWLIAELENKIPHKIMHHGKGSGKSRDAILEEFQEDDGIPKLLISPSITEGLYLKDDKGRFAIFAKVPFPFLGDAWVKKRMDLSDAWYKRQALTAMIQGGGRIVRSKEDWGCVYILDSSFGFLKSRCDKTMPKWWSKSIQTM